MLWIFGGKIPKLHLNPKEWQWKKQINLQKTNLFGYIIKRG
jgi:hypothetical protein